MKIVIDTNVVASAIFFGGRPRELLEMLIRRETEAFISREILEEYQATVEYLQQKYPAKRVTVPLAQIVAACTMTEPRRVVQVCRDPDDGKFIACALEAQCVYIVSGDQDLLTLKRYRDVEIVTVSEFFHRIGEQ